MNHLLTKDFVKDMFSDTIFRRGLTYYKAGRVSDLEFDFANQVWNATVAGTEYYDVNIEIDEYGSVSSECDCPAFDNYWECKHIVAVLLEISDLEAVPNQKKAAPRIGTLRKGQANEFGAAERFIELLSAFNDPEENVSALSRQEVMLEYIVKTKPLSFSSNRDTMLTLEIKAGEKRLYVIKKIKEFLKAVEQGSTYYVTKKFSFDPFEHTFSDEDQEIIHLLADLCRQEEDYRKTLSPYGYGSSSNDRELMIPPHMSGNLLAKMRERNFSFEHEGIPYQSIGFRENTLPFSFQLEKSSEENYKLEMDELLAASFFSRYGLLFSKGNLYKLSDKQQAVLKELSFYTKSLRGSALPIGKDQIGSFLTHVTPVLKRIGNTEIADSVSGKIVSPPLKAKMFVEEEAGRFISKVEYHYGESIINPFSGQQDPNHDNGIILMRDAEKERDIMGTIESAPFKVKESRLYLEGGEDTLYDFLYRVLPELENKVEIYTSSNVKSLMLPERQAPSVSIDIDSSGNWLEANFDMEGIDEKNIQQILQSVAEKKKYYRLPDGAFVSLENDEFQTIGQLFGELNVRKEELQSGSIKLPVYRGFAVEESIKNSSATFGKSFRRFLKALKNPDELDIEVPETLDASLRDYQQTGYQWLKMMSHYRLGGILADDMGLGKTLQSIAYLLSEKKEAKTPGTSLVVAPASLVYNWKSEIDKFAPELSAEVAIGTAKERKELLEHSPLPDIVLTSYPTLRQDIDWYSEQEFDSLILDEAQVIKNHAAKTSIAVRKIKASKRFALSGTPIENSIDELWSIFDAIMPGLFSNQQAFRGLSNEKISHMVRPFILRRVKKDVLKELPDKIETNHLSEMTQKQKELYVGYLEKIQQDTRDAIATEGFQKSRIKILAGLTRLRQLCCHPSLFLENYNGGSGKLDQFLEMAKNAIENGRRLLVFSQFTSMLKVIREQLDKEGLSYFYLDGKTPSKERIEMAETFNQGEGELFLISLKAGGTGLNLTGADTVVLYDLWWNPAVEEQAAGRAHRIGQKNVVQVLRLIARGTIEEKIYELQQKKKELIEQVIQPGETMLSSLSETEIRELLSI
ncbi:helicase SNF2 [Peribacillus cavernae]|uniref:Helicase SNF2 n=1 Tax=Peribacillus cavernae TaxID=1674310 RepID=A0A3S0VLI5_9BACI|nr:DEAD/DEAH box helicase [Peribacillus cavernae]MDQ0217748.1 SNF2 family DNA or RNA helicase [Peribacillus cavernae]RUQ28208.1 helicase SNF2 [Peribacillus cavernae]